VPWSQATVNEQREEFVRLATLESANVSELCRGFGISRKTGYKWLERWRATGPSGLADQSCRPQRSPLRTELALEQLALSVRDQHPCWGGRKIAHVLKRDHGVLLASSTVNSILKRHGRLDPASSQAATPWRRFEHEAPNDLWQMDFKGHFAIDAGRCYPLTVLDDHSRYNLVLQAMGGESYEPVRHTLEKAFKRFGLPLRINTDNGVPWVSPGHDGALTRLHLWFIRLGVQLSRSRPAHPQTNGKEERFHRTLKAEALGTRQFKDLRQVQSHFDRWRHCYNFERPHQAIGMLTPAGRYKPSRRRMPDVLPAIEYADGSLVRKVQEGGWTYIMGKEVRLAAPLRGYPVAFRPRADEDGVLDVYFCQHHLQTINLREI
jgi:transposase InsO family protein